MNVAAKKSDSYILGEKFNRYLSCILNCDNQTTIGIFLAILAPHVSLFRQHVKQVFLYFLVPPGIFSFTMVELDAFDHI